MCNLNSKGDLTLKLLNLDLFYKGYPVFVLRIYQTQNVISQLIFEILERFFSFQLPLNISIKSRIKIWSFKGLTDLRMNLSLSATVVHAVSILQLMFA